MVQQGRNSSALPLSVESVKGRYVSASVFLRANVCLTSLGTPNRPFRFRHVMAARRPCWTFSRTGSILGSGRERRRHPVGGRGVSAKCLHAAPRSADGASAGPQEVSAASSPIAREVGGLKRRAKKIGVLAELTLSVTCCDSWKLLRDASVARCHKM